MIDHASEMAFVRVVDSKAFPAAPTWANSVAVRKLVPAGDATRRALLAAHHAGIEPHEDGECLCRRQRIVARSRR